MTKLFFIRHGPTHAKGMVGWTDLAADLSDTATLTRLEAALPKDAPVISSDLRRAITTADAIQAERPRLPHDPALREINFGDWEMKVFSDLEADDPARLRAFYETPGDISPPNGDSWNALCTRTNAAVDRLVANSRAENLIVVAHFGVILSQVQRAFGFTAYQTFAHQVENLSITDMQVKDSFWTGGQISYLP
ncbi:MAG: histidine phosphatase family protein [Paracoccaceae bacterium]|nr:histidine phosphatase family protein [Paracoccaceae bacterium]